MLPWAYCSNPPARSIAASRIEVDAISYSGLLSCGPIIMTIIFVFLVAGCLFSHSKSLPLIHTSHRRLNARPRWLCWSKPNILDSNSISCGIFVKWNFYVVLLISPRYVMKVYHPNIDLEGNVCLNILREDWKPVLNINTVIYGLNHLFMVCGFTSVDGLHVDFSNLNYSNIPQHLRKKKCNCGGDYFESEIVFG